MKKKMIASLMMLAAMAGSTIAANVTVSDHIAQDTRWTADNVYSLEGQVYVLPGASLTIDAGTLVKSPEGGSLAVCRGAMIFVNGTATNPVIMTSDQDSMTSWHAGANEWGNLTLMGEGVIGYNYGDLSAAMPGAQAQMEGLTANAAEGITSEMTYYGGTNDSDDSGSISYLSIRYGGKVESLNKELNGLSLGAIGSNTDIHHVEIMNNVDDGIEIWGGTVNLSYISIWNIGDDSLDADQGWRGTAQYGIIVQGYSLNASQGSGSGDNCFEIDGAEDSDATPTSDVKIANFTVVGQPYSGDGATTWRDNANVKYHNCIFMDIGEELVRFDNIDGDGASGYGYNGTKSWTDRWADGDCYIKGSVMYNNATDSGDQAAAVGVFAAANDNITASTMPISALTRDTVAIAGGKPFANVAYIDPTPANDALTAGVTMAAPLDAAGSAFRGGFAPNYNWLGGWTAASQYGMTVSSLPSVGSVPGDLTGDEKVNLDDFAELAENWLN